MKKIIVFVILVMASLNGFAYEKGPGFYVEYGQSLLPVETNGISREYGWGEYVRQNTDYIAYTEINIHYVFQVWNLYIVPFTSLKTWVIPSAVQLNGKPFCDIYTVGSEIKYAGLSLQLDHYCAHNVRSNERMWQVKDYRMGQNTTEIKLRYSFN